MRDSTSEEGREEEARKLLRRFGEKRFGAPGPTVLAALERITDLASLEFLFHRLLDPDLTSWEQLLKTLWPGHAAQTYAHIWNMHAYSPRLISFPTHPPAY